MLRTLSDYRYLRECALLPAKAVAASLPTGGEIGPEVFEKATAYAAAQYQRRARCHARQVLFTPPTGIGYESIWPRLVQETISAEIVLNKHRPYPFSPAPVASAPGA